MAGIIDLYLGGVIESYIENECIKDPRYDTPTFMILTDLISHGLRFDPACCNGTFEYSRNQLVRVMKTFYGFSTIIYHGYGCNITESYIKGILIKNYNKIAKRLGDLDCYTVDSYEQDNDPDFDYSEEAAESAIFRDELLKESNGLPIMRTTKKGSYPLLYILEQAFADSELIDIL